MIPQNTVSIDDEKQRLMMNKLLDNLEDSDDVQEVYHNWANPDED
jgi:transcriptional/translational regulatory protein YebC/TACO1